MRLKSGVEVEDSVLVDERLERSGEMAGSVRTKPWGRVTVEVNVTRRASTQESVSEQKLTPKPSQVVRHENKLKLSATTETRETRLNPLSVLYPSHPCISCQLQLGGATTPCTTGDAVEPITCRK